MVEQSRRRGAAEVEAKKVINEGAAHKPPSQVLGLGNEVVINRLPSYRVDTSSALMCYLMDCVA